MPISADKIRELAARPEGPTLDFKELDYDWSKKTTNRELAKDLMALANSLGANASPAYILVGVKDDGTIVGITPASHQDDAVLHEKVKRLLNQTPRFSYAPVDVDGRSVGVYEVRAGGRPFFPLKDAPPLQRHVSVYRNGSATDVASPTMVLEWARADDPDAHRLRSLELRKLEAEVKIHGRLRERGWQFGADETTITLVIANQGQSAFFVDRCEWRVEWNERFANEVSKAKVALPDDYDPPKGEFELDCKGIVPPGSEAGFSFVWSRADAVAHLARIGVPGFHGNWADYHFSIDCTGELGGTATIRHGARG